MLEVEPRQARGMHRFGKKSARERVALAGLIQPLDADGEQCDEHRARLDEAHCFCASTARAAKESFFAAVLSLRLLEVLKTRFFGSSQKMHSVDELSTPLAKYSATAPRKTNSGRKRASVCKATSGRQQKRTAAQAARTRRKYYFEPVIRAPRPLLGP